MESSQQAARLLVIAAESVRGREVLDEIKRRAGDGAEVRVIAPALAETSLENVMGDVDHGRERAAKRLEESREALSRAGVEATGEIGDADLRLAIQDALQTFDADEIVIVAHADKAPVWERRAIEEAEHDFEPPITELFVTTDGETPHVADVEHVDAGKHPREDERESRSGNLPRFNPMDIAGIVVAIAGTLILAFLAAGCDEGRNATGGFGSEDAGGFNHCSAQLLIAGVVGLINIAHVIGLTLFQAGPYRGAAQKLFSYMSLVGTLAAIPVFLFLLDG